MAKSFDNINRLVVGELDISQDQKKSYKITMTGDALKFLNRSNSSETFVLNKDGSFILPTAMSSSPDSPASGGVVFTKSDGKLYFKNSSGTEYNITDTGESGDITSVVAGVGLSGGGTSGDVSLALDVSELTALGTTAASGDYVILQDVTDNSTKKVLVSNLPSSGGGATLSNGVNNRVVTAAGASSLNGEANLTFDTQLHITRAATVGNIGSVTLGSATLKITDSSTSMYIDGNSINTEANSYINVSTNNDLYFGTNNTERMRIKDNGLVGIGTNSPNAGLHIDVADEPQILLDGGDDDHGDIVVPTGEILQMGHWDNTDDTYTHRFRINSNGSIDIAGLLTANEVSATTLDIGGTNITATATELNYVDGVTSAIQTQLNTNVADISTNSSNISTVSSQVSTKAPIANPTFTGEIGIGSVNVSETELGILEGATLSTTELNYVDGVTSAIQAQLNTNAAGISTNSSNISTVSSQVSTKANIASPTFTGDATFDTNTLFVDSSDNDVRIGTTSALSNEKLHVRNSSTGATTGILISKGGSTGDEYLDMSIAGTDLAQITAGAVGTGDCALAFRTSDDSEAERMRISAEGNIGIGTTGPKVPLDIYEMGGLVLAQTVIQGTGGNTLKSLSTTMSVLGSNSKVTFTAPSNEKVMIEVYIPYVFSGTGDNFYVGLSSASSFTLWDSSNKYNQRVSRTLDGEPVVVQILVDSGLTSGSSTEIWIGAKEGSASTDIYLGGTDAESLGPLIIRAVTVPNTWATHTSL